MSDDDSASAKSAKSDLDEEEYVVEAVVGKRVKGGVLQYLLKWKGYSSAENTWEPEENCGCPELIAEYNRNELKKKSAKGKASSSKAGTSSSRAEPSTSSGKGANKRKRTDDSDQDEPVTISDAESNATNNSISPKKSRTTRGGGKRAPARKSARVAHDSDSDFEVDKKSEASSDSFKPAKKATKKVSHIESSDEEYKNSGSDKETRKEVSKKKTTNNNHSSKDRGATVTVKERPKRRFASPDDASDDTNENKEDTHAEDGAKETAGDTFKTDDGHLEPEKIIGATSHDGQVMYLIKWKNMNKADLISSKIAKIACPQIVLAFLEERLKWDDLNPPSKVALDV